MKYSYNFDNKKKIGKKRIIFVIVFIALVLTTSSFIFKDSSNIVIRNISNVVISPFKSFYNAFYGLSYGTKQYFANTKKLSSQNEELENEVKDMQYSLLDVERLKKENDSLKQMLKINTVFQHFNVKYAKIIAREHDNWTQTFVLDIGSKDGIKENQSVIHENGLVGYISKVNEDTSTVVTILDPIVSVSVNISTINEFAVLQGDLTLKANNRLRLVYIPIGAEVSVGDVLYSSGLGSIYPSGLPVAKIVDVVNKKNDIDRYAIAETTVNIRTISEVGIIVN
ncbi:MAG: rod shape-determining protein MreC [Clostridia bacterium]|nr:rod shape-determining protein MreC [Clostridia bacterium]